MNHEKIIKRPDGSQVKILVSVSIDYFNSYWNISVYTKPKNGKKWIGENYTNDYAYRSLGMKERKDYEMRESLNIATASEINEAMDELYDKIKPPLLKQPLNLSFT